MENMSEENFISLICNGELDAIEGISIGKLFEAFFDNINYNVIREKELFVDFTGDAICDDEPCTILIRFKINEKTQEFEISKVKVNEDILNEIEIIDLLEDIAYVSGIEIENDHCCCEDGCESCSNDECKFSDEDTPDNDKE